MWESPPEIACKMAALLTNKDLAILCPAAGRGNIARYIKAGWLPTKQVRGVCAVELNPQRMADGKILAPYVWWKCADFLKLEPVAEYDVAIENPPFSLAMSFLERSLLWLNPANPDARLLYLLPGDFFASRERCDQFEALDCHIHHRYRIRGRVAYIKEGVQVEGRMIYDCVYDIRPGKIGASETVL
jgi:hypothetical protein